MTHGFCIYVDLDNFYGPILIKKIGQKAKRLSPRS